MTAAALSVKAEGCRSSPPMTDDLWVPTSPRGRGLGTSRTIRPTIVSVTTAGMTQNRCGGVMPIEDTDEKTPTQRTLLFQLQQPSCGWNSHGGLIFTRSSQPGVSMRSHSQEGYRPIRPKSHRRELECCLGSHLPVSRYLPTAVRWHRHEGPDA